MTTETRVDRIGIDGGTPMAAAANAVALREAGAAMVRVRFGLEGWTEPDEGFLAAMRAAVATIRAAGLTVLGVIDGDLTVAPEGMGAFADQPQGMLARAWTDEMLDNTARLVAGLADDVAAWEILPEPNRGGDTPRIAPARWAALLSEISARVRQTAPGAQIVVGGLISDDEEDAVDYLTAAYRAAADDRLWWPGPPPFDGLGVRLSVLADGGSTGDMVAARVGERVRRLWRVMERFDGTAAAQARGVYVTGVAWDAARVGDDVQARNLWAALNALTSDPIVRVAIWTGLDDANPNAEGATGLYRGAGAVAGERRYAWRAFNDFAVYARQISPAVGVEAFLADAGAAEAWAPPEPEPEPQAAVEAAEAEAEVAEADVPLEIPIETEAALDVPIEAEAPISPPTEPEVPTTWLGEIPHPAEPEPWEMTTPSELSTDEDLEPTTSPEPEPPDAWADSEPWTWQVEESEAIVMLDIDEGDDLVAAADVVEPEEVAAAADADLAEPVDIAGAAVAEPPVVGVIEPSPPPPTPAAAEPEAVVFRIPDVAEVLRSHGFEGARLTAILEAVRQKYGDEAWLPAGEYRVTVRAPGSEPAPAVTVPTYTNQQIISALYRAGGGTWDLFERSGLKLGDLAARRTQVYGGPAVAAMVGLDAEERAIVERELAGMGSGGR